MDSCDAIANAVLDFWKDNYPQDVVAFFQQKYSWDDKWDRCEELVECHGCDDYENMTFLSDFCEGQTEVKDVVIVPLREVTAFYYERKIAISEIKPTNADRIRSMTDEELADVFAMNSDCISCNCRNAEDDCSIVDGTCQQQWLDWLKQESENLNE